MDTETKIYIDTELRKVWYSRTGDELFLWAGIAMVAAHTIGGPVYAAYFGVLSVCAIVAAVVVKSKGDDWA